MNASPVSSSVETFDVAGQIARVRFPAEVTHQQIQRAIDDHHPSTVSLAEMETVLAGMGASFADWENGTAGSLGAYWNAPTFSVLKGDRFLGTGLALEAALALSEEHMGHACVIDDATGKIGCVLGIEHACVCEACCPENWQHGEAESLESDVADARAALTAEGSAS